MSDTVNHHFVPQFYLRGFSDAADKRKAQVFVVDQTKHKSFRTLVRNIGARRNFFRIDVEGFNPNHVEDSMAEIEGVIAPLLQEVIATKSFPSDDHFSAVMVLMGNIAVRNPRSRSNMEQLHLSIARRAMALIVQDEGRYQDAIASAREQGAPVRADLSYGDMKALIDRGAIDIAIDQTFLVSLELDAVPIVVEQLARRSWSFAEATPGTAFITCDDPVVLDWADGKDHGPYSPGFGVAGTMVLFPLSPELALTGLFKELPPRRSFRRDQVCALNTNLAKHAASQLYARDHEFEVNTWSRAYTRGADLPAVLSRQRKRKRAEATGNV